MSATLNMHSGDARSQHLDSTWPTLTAVSDLLGSSDQTLAQKRSLVGASSKAMLQAGMCSLLGGSCTVALSAETRRLKDQVAAPHPPFGCGSTGGMRRSHLV